MAMMLLSRAHQMRLSGWKRASPASYQRFGPSSDMELMCIQSPIPPPDLSQFGLRNMRLLASSRKPSSSKCSLQTHSQTTSPAQSTSMIVSSSSGRSQISALRRFLCERTMVLPRSVRGSRPGA